MKKKEKPAYGTISQNGGLYTVSYYRGEFGRSSLQGYSIDTFRDCPDEMPVIDFRPADFGKIVTEVLKGEDCRETASYGTLSLPDYLESKRKTGAKIWTLGELRKHESQAA